MDKEKSLGFIGLGLTLAGALLTLAQRKVSSQQLDNKIDKAVNKALESKKRS